MNQHILLECVWTCSTGATELTSPNWRVRHVEGSIVSEHRAEVG